MLQRMSNCSHWQRENVYESRSETSREENFRQEFFTLHVLSIIDILLSRGIGNETSLGDKDKEGKRDNIKDKVRW